jgi:phosphoribosyl-AMP cyclohydrolase / phosphoribosyl-ATP pyrophosphohydrolase
MLDLDALNFAKGEGLVTVVAQDAESGAVLMVAHADREALQRTLDTGEMHYRSRTRGLWHKGATSGNTQQVVTMLADCDGDAVLARVRSAGPACHTGARSCFGQEALAAEVFGALDATIEARATESTPEPVTGKPSYTRRLLSDRNLRLKKVGEEAAEFITGCADGDRPRAIEEFADLFYHALVALRAVGGTITDARAAFSSRVGAPRR